MNLQTLLANKHTSGSALVFAVVKVTARIAESWFPEHYTQIQTTSDAIESLAVAYLGFAAVDATQARKTTEDTKEQVKVAIETHDTSLLSKEKKL